MPMLIIRGRLSKTLTAAAGTLAQPYAIADSIVFASPVVDKDGVVYIGAYDGKIRAIGTDGTVKWEVQTGDIVESTPALSQDGALYVGSHDGNLYCIETQDNGTIKAGDIRFKVPVNGTIYGSPVISPTGMVYFGTDTGGTLYAVDGLTGAIKWPINPPQTANGIESTPALVGDGDNALLYFGDAAGFVHAVKVTDGTDAFLAFKADDAILTSSCAVGDDGTIYVGTAGGKLYALNSDLTQKWVFDAGAPIYATPTISTDSNTIYFGTFDTFSGLNQSKVFALAASSGGVVPGWPFATNDGVTASAAFGSDNTLYVTSLDRNLYALKPDGKVKWQVDIGGATPPAGLGIESSPAFGPDGAIYFGSTDGKVNIVR